MTSQLRVGQFCYRDLQLKKERCLGGGCTGSVHRVKWRELTCAAKILHPPAPNSMAYEGEGEQERFLQDCELLCKMKHPSIVQYLGFGMLSNSREKVLLMELLDESLTTFLSRHELPIPLHLETDICHDVALALAYLHGNNIIHSNLSSNNVLVVGGKRSKVNDFGMKANGIQLFSQNSRCHGYQSPEVNTSPPSYSEKSDSFSFGVLALQVMCRLNPDPTPPTKTVHTPNPSNGTTSVPVMETERRQAHIDLIDPSHPLLPIALECLSMSQHRRPTASELCSRLEGVKKVQVYQDSVRGVTQQRARRARETVVEGERWRGTHNKMVDGQVGGKVEEELQQQLRESSQQVQQLRRQLASQQGELSRLHGEVREREATVAQLQWQLQGEQSETIVLRKQASQREENVKSYQVEFVLVREEASKCLISMVQAQRRLRQTLEQNRWLEQQVAVQSEEVEHLTQQLQEEVEAHRRDVLELEERLNTKILSLRKELRVATRGAAQKTALQKSVSHPVLGKTHSVDSSPGPDHAQAVPKLVPLHSKELAPQGIKKAPVKFHTGVSASHLHMCYFSSFLTNEVLAYNSDNGQWQLLPICPVSDFGLEVVNARVTLIGGRLATTNHQENCTNQLLSLVREGGREGATEARKVVWREELPEMTLARAQPATACSRHLLIVAGGEIGDKRTLIADIEVLDLQTRLWSKVASSPLGSYNRLSAVMCRSHLYLVEARGETEKDRIHALPMLLTQGGKRTLSHGLPWKHLKHVPASNSTCANVGGTLVAVGGMDGHGESTNQIWAFNESSERWRSVGKMKTARYRLLVGVANNSTLLVVGGLTKTRPTDEMEVFSTI